MGLFDDVIVNYELPIPNFPKKGWQTKGLDCAMRVYEINEYGRLLERNWAMKFDDDGEVYESDKEKWLDRNFEGAFNIYQSVDKNWCEFKVIMIDGAVVKIVTVKNEPLEPVK